MERKRMGGIGIAFENKSSGLKGKFGGLQTLSNQTSSRLDSVKSSINSYFARLNAGASYARFILEMKMELKAGPPEGSVRNGLERVELNLASCQSGF